MRVSRSCRRSTSEQRCGAWRRTCSLLAALCCVLGCGGMPPAPGNGGGGNGSGNGDGDDPASMVFPADYRASYRLVRDCRLSSSHPSMIRVWVNEIGADAYLANDNPLPEGTVVIKEEYGGTSCDADTELVSWAVMGKQAAGFDPEDGDWSWHRVVAPDRRILTDTKAGCVSCHRAPECLERDLMCTLP